MNEPQVIKKSDDESKILEFLTFRLGDEDYGIDILRVQEIRGWEMVTRTPNSPDYVKGVLNLRGSIVPIIDMRQRLGMAVKEYSKNTVVIVLRVISNSNQKNVGIVVDEVSDVLNSQRGSIYDAPRFGSGIPVEYITGLADSDGKMVMLLDIDRLLCGHRESEKSDQESL
jgi:purine-binding chemotaxis protein CheW